MAGHLQTWGCCAQYITLWTTLFSFLVRLLHSILRPKQCLHTINNIIWMQVVKTNFFYEFHFDYMCLVCCYCYHYNLWTLYCCSRQFTELRMFKLHLYTEYFFKNSNTLIQLVQYKIQNKICNEKYVNLTSCRESIYLQRLRCKYIQTATTNEAIG